MSLNVKVNYRGIELALSPEASMRYRKIAKGRGVSVASVVKEMLSNAKAVGPSIFLPCK